MKRYAFLAVLLALSGVLAACGAVPIQKVKVPIPVECEIEVPARPAMPTEGLVEGVDIDRFAAAATAEIELRRVTKMNSELRLVNARGS